MDIDWILTLIDQDDYTQKEHWENQCVNQDIHSQEVHIQEGRWTNQLNDLIEQLSPHLYRLEIRERMKSYLYGLLGSTKRKTSWQLANYIGDTKPYGIQHLLLRAKWDPDLLRNDISKYLLQLLGDERAILVAHELSFPKKGRSSVGVKLQYSDAAQHMENCQIGVFLTYSSWKGSALLDRELYLPEDWVHDICRRSRSHIPEEVTFVSKGQLVRNMLERALKIELPFRWIVGDSFCWEDHHLRSWFKENKTPFVIATTGQESFYVERGQIHERISIAQILNQLEPAQWKHINIEGIADNEAIYDWIRLPFNFQPIPDWCYWLVAHRSTNKPKVFSSYIAFGPKDTSLRELAYIIIYRNRIRTYIENIRNRVGLDLYDVRSWPGWYRHITLAMLALLLYFLGRNETL